jgi:hypothetical protein
MKYPFLTRTISSHHAARNLGSITRPASRHSRTQCFLSSCRIPRTIQEDWIQDCWSEKSWACGQLMCPRFTVRLRLDGLLELPVRRRQDVSPDRIGRRWRVGRGRRFGRSDAIPVLSPPLPALLLELSPLINHILSRGLAGDGQAPEEGRA